MSAISGLAASIRAATESETFDLGGQNVSTITNTIQAAFADPLPLQEMIRITFVTGAGKLGRAKYDDGAARAVTSTLRDLGFEDDRGASAVLECAGCFKLQHDTGKNLKTVVVFPHVDGESTTGDVEGGMESLSMGGGPVLPESSPEHSIAFASQNVFERMLTSKCQTWTQKKGAITAIDTIKTKLEELEQKLMTGTPLSDPEQSFYDAVSATVLEEKLAFVKGELQQQVDDGKLTVGERKALLEQVSERLSHLAEEKGQAETDGKAKRVQNLTNAIAKAEERKEKLEKIVAKSPPPLKHEADIEKLRKELGPLLPLEEASKGRLLSVKETQALGRKQELDDEIAQLEEASRGWFEEDESFQSRARASDMAWMAKIKRAAKTKKGSKTGGSKPVSSWSTPGMSKKPAGTKKAAAKPKAKGSSVFAAMMMDSDSD